MTDRACALFAKRLERGLLNPQPVGGCDTRAFGQTTDFGSPSQDITKHCGLRWQYVRELCFDFMRSVGHGGDIVATQGVSRKGAPCRRCQKLRVSRELVGCGGSQPP